MKKIIFGIFAHPDDEAFGPAGTLLMETRAGSELHLVSLTAGENGMNPDNVPDLKAARLDEWQTAAELLGATSTEHLGFEDGRLSNMDMVQICDQIIQLVKQHFDGKTDVEIEFMTLDINGLTGHVDHIVAARATCLAFYRLKQAGLPMARLRLFCLPSKQVPNINTDWLFMEPGRKPDEISEIIDASHLFDEVVAIIRTHHSQRGDGDKHLADLGKALAINHFMILN